MIYYLLLPFISVLLIVLQSTLADILFSGWLTLELSLVAVMYAGFHLDLMKGMVLAFVMGIIFDCVSGSVLGLFTLIYLFIYLLAFFASFRIVAEKLHLIALFSLGCSLLETLILIAVYRFVFDFDMTHNMLMVFIFQALLIIVLSVGFFYAMRKIKGLTYGKTMQPPQRTGAVGISAET